MRLELAHAGNAQRHHGQRRIDLQRGQRVVGKRRPHVGKAWQSQVRLVCAELPHGLVVGHARKGNRQIDTRSRKARLHKLLHHAEDRVLLREAHLQIHLRELKLAVGAQILVAEAPCNLKIPVEARDHQDLLEDLRRLRQRIELAGMHAAGHQKIARALGRGLGQDRGFDLEEALLAQALANGQRDLVAQAEVVLHLGPAQIDVAVFEPHFLVLDCFFRRRKRRQPRVVQHTRSSVASISISPVGILGLIASLSRKRTLPTAATTYSGRTCSPFAWPSGIRLVVKHHLRNSCAVAEVEEDQVAVVAAPVHPAHQHHLLARVGSAQRAAHVGPFEIP